MSNENNVIQVNFGSSKVEAIVAPEPVPQESVEKLALFTEMVAGGTVLVTLDTRVDGVVLPGHLLGNLQLNLNFDHDYGISDFDYDAQGVRASLSFGGVNHWCDIPWPSVYILRTEVAEEAVAFPESLPAELAALVPQFQKMLEEAELAEGEEE